MALTRRQDRMDFVHAGIDGTLCSLVVGYQRRIDRAWPTLAARHDLLSIPELWHCLRMDKGGHLYTGNPSGTEPVDHFYFQIRRDELWLDLEAIARPHLTHGDVFCHVLSFRLPYTLGHGCRCGIAIRSAGPESDRDGLPCVRDKSRRKFPPPQRRPQ